MSDKQRALDAEYKEKVEAMSAAAKPTPPPKAGKPRSISIRKLENGFIASAGYEPAETTKGDACCSWVPDKEYVLTDREAIHKFVDDVFDFKSKQQGACNE